MDEKMKRLEELQSELKKLRQEIKREKRKQYAKENYKYKKDRYYITTFYIPKDIPEDKKYFEILKKIAKKLNISGIVLNGEIKNIDEL